MFKHGSKITAWMLIAVFCAFALAACGNSEDGKTQGPAESQQTTETENADPMAPQEETTDMALKLTTPKEDDTVEGGVEAINKLLEAGYHPDAILCSSDVTAIGCVKAYVEHGYQVPEQVSVLGLEDNGVGLYATPELSTIAAAQMVAGETAMRLLDKLINGAVEAGYIAPLQYQMIVRGTSQEQSGLPVHQWGKGRWVDTPDF